MDKSLLLNCQETCSGVKYAFKPENEYNIGYIAECREYDESFLIKFYGKADYIKEQLMEIGSELAQIYGANCLNVIRA